MLHLLSLLLSLILLRCLSLLGFVTGVGGGVRLGSPLRSGLAEVGALVQGKLSTLLTLSRDASILLLRTELVPMMAARAMGPALPAASADCA